MTIMVNQELMKSAQQIQQACEMKMNGRHVHKFKNLINRLKIAAEVYDTDPVFYKEQYDKTVKEILELMKQ